MIYHEVLKDWQCGRLNETLGELHRENEWEDCSAMLPTSRSSSNHAAGGGEGGGSVEETMKMKEEQARKEKQVAERLEQARIDDTARVSKSEEALQIKEQQELEQRAVEEEEEEQARNTYQEAERLEQVRIEATRVAKDDLHVRF